MLTNTITNIVSSRLSNRDGGDGVGVETVWQNSHFIQDIQSVLLRDMVKSLKGLRNSHRPLIDRLKSRHPKRQYKDLS